MTIVEMYVAQIEPHDEILKVFGRHENMRFARTGVKKTGGIYHTRLYPVKTDNKQEEEK